jgi:hypothetical protein
VTLSWREMDSNHRYRIRNNPFLLPPFGPAIRLPQQKSALSCRGPIVRIHLPPAESRANHRFPKGDAESLDVLNAMIIRGSWAKDLDPIWRPVAYVIGERFTWADGAFYHAWRLAESLRIASGKQPTG